VKKSENTLSVRGFQGNLGKHDAYRKNIEIFQRESGQKKLRPDQQYWTLVLNKSDEATIMSRDLGVSPSQFHGVNRDPEVYEKCLAEYPGANLYLGDWCDVLDQQEICPNGGLIYIDSTSEFDRENGHPIASAMVTKALNRAGVGTLVCMNMCAENLRHPSAEISEKTFAERLRRQTDNPQMVSYIDRYEPQKSYTTQMRCLYFWKEVRVKCASSMVYTSNSPPPPADQPRSDDKTVLYPWQSGFAKGIVSSWRSRVIAPTGSGKTTLMKAAGQLANNEGKRVLFVVPQRHIGLAFIQRADLIIDDMGLSCPRIEPNNVYLDSKNESYGRDGFANGLFTWLQSAKASNGKGSAITSMHTLVRVAERVKEAGLNIDDLLIFQDEAHHISNVSISASDEDCTEEEIALEQETGTKLGAFYEYVLNRTKAGVCIVSATHFRGDKVPMFLDDAAYALQKFELPFLDHWKWLGFKSFNYDFIGYDGTYSIETLIQTIRFERGEKHIVCVPGDGRRFRSDPAWVTRLFTALRAEFGEDRVLDLVTPGGVRDRNKISMFEDNDLFKKGEESRFDVIVACNLMREGTDWGPATRIHDMAPSASLTRTVQTIGRLLRKDRHGRKVTVAYRPYFKNLDKRAGEEEIRALTADHANVSLATLTLSETLFDPPDAVPSPSGGSSEPRETLTDRLERVFGDRKEAVLNRLVASLNPAINPARGDQEDRVIWALQSTSYKEFLQDESLKGQALSALKAFANHHLRSEHAGAGIEITPPLRVLGMNPEQIREAGFDKTVRGDEFSFETNMDTEQFEELQKVLRKIAAPRGSDKRDKADATDLKHNSNKKKARRVKTLLKKGKLLGHSSIHSTEQASAHEKENFD